MQILLRHLFVACSICTWVLVNLVTSSPVPVTERWAPELIPVYRQSSHRWVSYPPGGRLPLLSARPAVTFPAKEHPAHRPVPNSTASWQRHMRVSSLPNAVTWKRTGWDLNFLGREWMLLLYHYAIQASHWRAPQKWLNWSRYRWEEDFHVPREPF